MTENYAIIQHRTLDLKGLFGRKVFELFLVLHLILQYIQVNEAGLLYTIRKQWWDVLSLLQYHNVTMYAEQYCN